MGMSGGRRRRQRGVLVAATSALVLVCTTLITGSTAAAADGGLDIDSRTPERIRGSFTRGGSTVTFASRQSEPESAESYAQGHGLYGAPVVAHMSVNGDEFRVALNPDTRSVEWQASPGAALSRKDKAAARAAMAGLAAYLQASDATLRNEQALLLRSLAYAAAAPTGFELEDGGTQYAVECGHVGAGEAGNGAGDVRTQSDTGIVLLNCNSSRNRTFHDALDHGRRSFVVRSGPASGIDRGRCGAAGSFLQFGWTQDCLDHDWCSEVHDSFLGPLDLDCGDEFRDAIDDFLLTTPGECYLPEADEEERRDGSRPESRDPSEVG